jgi:ABC-2 type transport system permease protein
VTAARVLAAFVRRDWITTRSYRVPFVLDAVTMLASVALFFYIGRLVDRSPSGDLRHGYFAFAAVGLAYIRLLQVGLIGFAAKVRDEQLTGTFEVLMAAPVRPGLAVVAGAVYEELRAAIGAALLLIVAVAFFGLDLAPGAAGALAAVLALGASLALFTSLGIAVAAFTVVFKQTTAAVGVLVTGVTLLAGVYFPTGVLPGGLQAVAEALPVTWALDALRSSLLAGDVDWLALGGAWAAAAVALAAALAILRRALDHARRAGTLAQY